MKDKLGATGDYPEGKLNPDDEGGLKIAVHIEENNVRIDFGKPIAWLALPPTQAFEFASSIIMRAKEIKMKERSK